MLVVYGVALHVKVYYYDHHRAWPIYHKKVGNQPGCAWSLIK